MKKLLSLLCVCAILFYGCSSTKPAVTNPGSPGVLNNAGAERDGSTMAKAIIIKANNESDGISAEYAWLKEHYPGYVAKGQALLENGGTPYDLIHIVYNGKNMDVYFDIKSYFGKL